ncbi:hypothetical protein NP493_4652g00002 [Ridgeia piscesae]|uniref:Uncharacterized protein n=1 Tax=Ridgeia piscesae TaxID=27915 RepID=A0AAD9MT71_RIDPI|nr:hypothetical protein NP493_4652g00002 [Ridgeia piscesae]
MDVRSIANFPKVPFSEVSLTVSTMIFTVLEAAAFFTASSYFTSTLTSTLPLLKVTSITSKLFSPNVCVRTALNFSTTSIFKLLYASDALSFRSGVKLVLVNFKLTLTRAWSATGITGILPGKTEAIAIKPDVNVIKSSQIHMG